MYVRATNDIFSHIIISILFPESFSRQKTLWSRAILNNHRMFAIYGAVDYISMRE